MSGRSVDSVGVRAVPTSVEHAATELRTALDAVATAFAELKTGAGAGLTEIPAAIQAVMENAQGRLTAMVDRIHGDEQAAVTAEAAARPATASGDPSFSTAAGTP